MSPTCLHCGRDFKSAATVYKHYRLYGRPEGAELKGRGRPPRTAAAGGKGDQQLQLPGVEPGQGRAPPDGRARPAAGAVIQEIDLREVVLGMSTKMEKKGEKEKDEGEHYTCADCGYDVGTKPVKFCPKCGCEHNVEME